MPNQRARIDVADDRDLAAREKRIGLLIRAPVAGAGRKFAYHQAFDVGFDGLIVFRTGPVVADLRVGEDDNLAGIGRGR